MALAMTLASRVSERATTRARLARPRDARRVTRCASASAEKPWTPRDARLVLEDGSTWRARAFGARTTRVGEVVFNTSLSGCVMDLIVRV